MARTVLVVDDEPLVLEVIASMLEDLGCRVVTAANGIEALSKLSADPRISMLITDVSADQHVDHGCQHARHERL